ncbi:MAG: hypothetical protein ACXVJA_13130, partial [Acidimicrobiia bacterium]
LPPEAETVLHEFALAIIGAPEGAPTPPQTAHGADVGTIDSADEEASQAAPVVEAAPIEPDASSEADAPAEYLSQAAPLPDREMYA